MPQRAGETHIPVPKIIYQDEYDIWQALALASSAQISAVRDLGVAATGCSIWPFNIEPNDACAAQQQQQQRQNRERSLHHGVRGPVTERRGGSDGERSSRGCDASRSRRRPGDPAPGRTGGARQPVGTSVRELGAGGAGGRRQRIPAGGRKTPRRSRARGCTPSGNRSGSWHLHEGAPEFASRKRRQAPRQA